MVDPLYVGLAGAAILIGAWLFETIEAVKEHRSLIDLRFAIASIAAILLLIAYSWLRGDAIFYWLNIILAVIILLEIFYTVYFKIR